MSEYADEVSNTISASLLSVRGVCVMPRTAVLLLHRRRIYCCNVYTSYRVYGLIHAVPDHLFAHHLPASQTKGCREVARNKSYCCYRCSLASYLGLAPIPALPSASNSYSSSSGAVVSPKIRRDYTCDTAAQAAVTYQRNIKYTC